MSRPKITVVGAGNVGGSVAQRLAEKNCYDIVIVDIVPGLPQGKALDLAQAGAVCRYDSQVVGTNRYDETAGSSVVVITSGIARKPGMSRSELLETNTKIVRSVVEEICKQSPQAILVVVANPLDAMTHVAHRVSGFPKERVVGMAGVLDSARFCTFIAQELNVSVQNVQAMVLGGHGDAMVPLVRYTTVSGRPITQCLSSTRLEALVKRTREGGAEIVNLLKKGSAFYAPAASAVEMVDAIMKNEGKVLPCAALCEGEYGLKNLYMGVPVRLGRRGVDGIIDYELSPEEQKALQTSAKAVQELCDEVDRILDAD